MNITPPNLTQEEKTAITVRNLTAQLNRSKDDIKGTFIESFKSFWYTGRPGQAPVLKSKEEINAILEALDAVTPGQSKIPFAWASVLLTALVTAGVDIDPTQYQPPYELDVTDTSIRIKV